MPLFALMMLALAACQPPSSNDAQSQAAPRQPAPLDTAKPAPSGFLDKAPPAPVPRKLPPHGSLHPLKPAEPDK